MIPDYMSNYHFAREWIVHLNENFLLSDEESSNIRSLLMAPRLSINEALGIQMAEELITKFPEEAYKVLPRIASIEPRSLIGCERIELKL